MALKLTLAAAAITVLVSAVATQIELGGATQALASETQPTRRAATAGFTALVDTLDRRIDSLHARAADRPDDWLTRMHLGTALLERAGLTNRIEDFERVQQVLDEAFAIAPRGSGPLLLAARFNFSIHRLDVAERYLDQMDARALRKPDEHLVARVLRAEIALQRGHYDVALGGLTEVAAKRPEAASAELALYHAKTGNATEAERLLEDALASTTTKDPRRRAWLQLQLGILAMDRGRSLVALEHLRAADAELPGWWLVQEHLAEVHDRLGDHDQAIAIYEELLRTTELPQLMDALAIAYRHAGRGVQADALVARAAAAWEDQLARLPEAAMGHGLQHHLQFGTPERALGLAEANVALRPGGEAQVALGQAYLRAGRFADALAVARRTLATPYRSAGLHDVAARAHAALGDLTAEQEQLALRSAINPAHEGREHAH